MARMPCFSIAARCSGRSRRARMPPWTPGWSVFTRPSIISGKPVTSETSRTGTSARRRRSAVPPVDTTSTPRAASPRAKSTTPRFSYTLTSARFTFAMGPPSVFATSLRALSAQPPAQFRLEESVDLAVQHPVGVGGLEARPLVLHQPVGVEHVGPDVVAPPDLALLPVGLAQLLRLLLLP